MNGDFGDNDDADAKGASVATTGGLSPQRSSAKQILRGILVLHSRVVPRSDLLELGLHGIAHVETIDKLLH